MSYKFEKLEPSQYTEWDHYVESNNLGTVFHKTAWLLLLGGEMEVYITRIDSQIFGGVALVTTKKNGVQGYHIPPYTPYFSPLFGNTQLRSHHVKEEYQFISDLLKFIPRKGHIDFKFPPNNKIILPYHWNGYQSEIRLTHVIHNDITSYLRCLNKNKFREIKKLENMEDTQEIRVDSKIQPDSFLEILNQTGNRNEINVQEDVIRRILQTGNDEIFKTIAIYTPEFGYLSVGIFPYDKHTVYNLVNASTTIEHPILKTINLYLVYKAIQFALTTNRAFDFEGSMLPGVEAFFRLMGGTPEPIHRFQKSPSIRYSLMRAVNQLLNDRKRA